MARAVGTQRKQLIQQFIAEGAGYAILAGIIGSGLGVAASVGIANAMKLLFGQYVPITPHVEPRSMVVAYCLGVFITFLTVVVASWKVSRLNVVAAIRDIPDAALGKRKITSLIVGTLLLLGGAFLTQSRTRRRQGPPLLHRSQPGAVRTGADPSLLPRAGPAGLQPARPRDADPLAAAGEHRQEDLGRDGRRHRDVLRLRHAPGRRDHDPDHAEHRSPPDRRQQARRALQVEVAGGADGGRLSRRGAGPDRDDDRDVQLDRLLAGDDGDDEQELRRHLQRRRRQRGLGCPRRFDRRQSGDRLRRAP